MQRMVVGLSLILALVVTACGSSAPAAPAAPAATTAPVAPVEIVDGKLPEVNPLELSGDIIIMGSSTVYPLTEAMAERFIDEGFRGNITIDSVGSGAGFERFCVAGESDIANASRPIRDSEVESCRSIGREPLEIRVGTDALAIVIHPENDFLTDVDVETLALIFSDKVTNWSDVNEAWPATPILRFSPGTDSGTYDYFVEAVMDAAYGDEGEAAILNGANLQLSEDDNVLIQGVEGDVNAIGYFGYAYYEENAGRLGILNINGVEPTAATVDDNSYPLARPLFIYTSAAIMQGKPQVAGFINFYLTYVNEEVLRVGYFPANESALEEARQNWIAAFTD